MTKSSFVIRHGRQDDLIAITVLYNHYIENTAITFDIDPYTVEQREPWLAQFSVTGRHQLFVMADDTQLLGFAYSSLFRTRPAYAQSVETTIYLDEKAHGQGRGTKLHQALLHSLEREDIHRAYAAITLPNPASVALHRKLGYSQVGHFHEVGFKFGRYWDVAWLEKKLDG
jgi:phosphinothricin acetyltransferase